MPFLAKSVLKTSLGTRFFSVLRGGERVKNLLLKEQEEDFFCGELVILNPLPSCELMFGDKIV